MSADERASAANIKSVISRKEYISLLAQMNGEKQICSLETLLCVGVPRKIARMALSSIDDIGHSMRAWVREDDADGAAAMAVRNALRLCEWEGMSSAAIGYVSCRSLVETWRGADLYGASSRERSVAPLRAKHVLVLAGIDGSQGSDEAEALVALLEPRRLDMRPTFFSSSVDGRGFVAALRRSRTPEDVVTRVVKCIADCVQSLDEVIGQDMSGPEVSE